LMIGLTGTVLLVDKSSGAIWSRSWDRGIGYYNNDLKNLRYVLKIGQKSLGWLD